jgi:hypothetical protein
VNYVDDNFPLAPFDDPSLFVDTLPLLPVDEPPSVFNNNLFSFQREDTIFNNNSLQREVTACNNNLSLPQRESDTIVVSNNNHLSLSVPTPDTQREASLSTTNVPSLDPIIASSSTPTTFTQTTYPSVYHVCCSSVCLVYFTSARS